MAFRWLLTLPLFLVACSSSSGDPPAAVDGGGESPADAGEPDGEPVGPTDFYSGFEDGEPQPAWSNTVELDPRGVKLAGGVSGISGNMILGNVMDRVADVGASGENPPGEVASAATDGELTSKWLVFAPTGWLRITLSEDIVVRRYALSSGNDAPGRDPQSWTLEGSTDGNVWTPIDVRVGESFGERLQTRTFEFENSNAYRHYRLNVSANHGDGLLQLSELQLSDGDDTPPSAVDMKSAVGRGPGGSWNSALSKGFTGARALRFGGSVIGAHGYSTNKVFEVDLAVLPTSELSYKLFVDDAAADPSYPSTHVAVDLAFADGTYLSQLGAVDQHFAVASPAGQGRSRTLYAGEWNSKVIRIGEVAAGKQIKRILVGYDNPAGPTPQFGGWIDELRIEGRPPVVEVSHLSDHVLTTRGTASSGGYSRGNNFPATAVPHGFNFWTPVTDAGSDSWLYAYSRDNDLDNRPRLQALALSHEPSPWMGDRQSFQVMPQATSGTPDADRVRRSLAFSHADEIARPHHYRVAFEGGIVAELAPTDHAALFRFEFPGDDGALIFDQIANVGGLTLNAADRELSGYSDARSGLSAGATRLFFYARFDRDVAASGMLGGGGGPNVTGYFRFALGAEKLVHMRIATSLISVEQAKKNLALEIGESESFEAVKARAQKTWDDKLAIVQVEGANADQLTTLYSNLYRLFLYPNSGFENVGTAAAPVYKHASPVSPVGANTPTQTGAKVVDGKIYVNNGFWDTYRATWPLLSLLTPTQTGEMIDGFVQQYREGGWISRWSSPGYANLMTGTSSDVAFADAYVKGVRGFDAEDAYDAALRNATVPGPDGSVGRHGLDRSIFLGYTPTSTGAGLSWALAGVLNDFGIAGMATELAKLGGPRQKRYAEEAEYFRDRALAYVNHFDPAVGFFQGRNESGSFRLDPGAYDPKRWGDDYTETNGWNMAFDAPHDGAGLAALYGGRDGLASKLDAFFATPELADDGGGYGGIIHEMREARDVRMGQLGLSNQPSFHIPYVYLLAGQPARTQALVRDALQRLFVGSDIGQGFLGDEDNGAMASWYIFGALGFYPLGVGSPNYVIGSPLFSKATIRLENGKTIVVVASGNSAKNVYVAAARLNGRDLDRVWLSHDELVAGATLELTMTDTPSAWGAGVEAAPPSISTGVPAPLRDVAAGQGNLSDDFSGSQVSFAAANPTVIFELPDAREVRFYTLTSGSTAADFSAWKLEGSTDGATWVTLDQRSGESFTWRRQTRPFKVATPGSYSRYRLVFTGSAGRQLAEVELLAK